MGKYTTGYTAEDGTFFPGAHGNEDCERYELRAAITAWLVNEGVVSVDDNDFAGAVVEAVQARYNLYERWDYKADHQDESETPVGPPEAPATEK